MTRWIRRTSLWLLTMTWASLTGCGPTVPDREEPGPFMRPGDNCLRCHSANSGTGAPVWSAGGTVYAKPDAAESEGVEGAVVTLTDATGKVVELTTNAVGNFYTPEPLATPFGVSLSYRGQSIDMPFPPPAGSCNACHDHPDPVGNPPPPGRIYVP